MNLKLILTSTTRIHTRILNSFFGIVRNCSSECRKIKEADLRNIGIMAHIDAGKTTTTERMLFYSGYTQLLGEVHDGNTVTDYMDQERERGITITSAAISFPWASKMINLIDTPGHVDFTIEVERSLRVLDGAVAIFDASAGVEAQSMTVWLQADRYSLPRIAYLNKMDKSTSDLKMCLNHLKQKLGANILLLQMPVGHGSTFKGVIDLIRMKKLLWNENSENRNESVHCEALTAEKDQTLWEESLALRSSLVEQVADLDNSLAELVLEKESTHLISPNSLIEALRRVTLDRTGVPLLLGSSYKNIAVQPLLDAICDFLPSPLDRVDDFNVKLFSPNLYATAFKIIHHKKRGPMTFIRIYSGTLKRNQRIYNVNKKITEKIVNLYQPFADDFKEIQEAASGSIIVTMGLKETTTGDTLMISKEDALKAQNSSAKFLGVPVPEPVFMCSIEAPSLSQQKNLDHALSCLQKEDPSLRVKIEEDTGQIVIAGMGELHLEIIKERIRREYKVDAELGPLLISYRETINEMVTHTTSFNKVIGDSKQAVTITLSLTPCKGYECKELKFHRSKENTENLINLKPIKVKAAWRGIQMALTTGPLYCFPVIDVIPKLHFLEATNRTSDNVIAAAASMCIKQILKQSQCVLLEPVMKIELVAPEEKAHKLLLELTKRRAQIDHVDQRQTMKIIEAHCPLAELVGFASAIRKISSGCASISMEFAYYRQMSDEEKEIAILKMSGLS